MSDDDKGSLKTTTEDFEDEAAAQAALQAEEARYNQLKARQSQRDTAQRQGRASKIVHEGSPLTVQKRKADVEAVVAHRNLVVLFRDYAAGLGSKDAFERHQEIEGGYREWNVQIRGSRKGAQITDDFQRNLLTFVGSQYAVVGAGIYLKKYAIPAPVFGDLQQIQIATDSPIPGAGRLIISERQFEENPAGYAALLAATQYHAFDTDNTGLFTILFTIGVCYSRSFSCYTPYENRDNEVGKTAAGGMLPGYPAPTPFKQNVIYAYLIISSAMPLTTEKLTVKLIPREVV